ncbi:tRNA-splicing endonuclease subunit SEN54 family protein [Aspergillus saccharolyticus JOP 1030-1]|uniref:Putative tRNA splicing endonuclease subunit n=1 Tax=Aspergillus saccharolyticus JOP 1030-1 TaxID=1450539 RepID=A0A318Z5F2_9EURO|nr:putative tRNA splicing endonuclease subunit [Aspergillus saccharolyticus JOP 1030-1]PYH42326.1 putative tRNA splicing endonuclease subunit [Aspergillus saccharolyticus JOP 1030-1]
MADADEAAIHLPSQDASAHIEIDLSDETQDFRMLSNISFLTDGSQASIPKRGEKDFEPNPTLYQADILSASRQAMHHALSHPRIHHPKNQIVGVYAPDGPAPPPQRTTTSVGGLESIAEGSGPAPAEPSPTTITTIGNVHPDACVYVANPKSNLFKTIGQADRWNRIWLLPEEALFMLERGSLNIRWPRSEVGFDEEEMDGNGVEDSGIPMSLQAAYAAFASRGGLNSERFSVYTGLRRLGYTITRAPGWDDDAEDTTGDDESTCNENARQQGGGAGLVGIYSRFINWLCPPSTNTALGPVAGVGFHRSYDDIYSKLSIIPWYDPTATPKAERSRAQAPYRVVFHVYKPSTPFKKSAPPAPDFRIAVVNARAHTSVPTMSQLGALLESTPLDPPSSEKMSRQMYMRLRHGYRNVILAVVDEGVVSYLRISEAAFGKEKLYKQKALGNKIQHRPKPKGR